MTNTTEINWTPIPVPSTGSIAHQEADLEGAFRAQTGWIGGVWPWFITPIGDDDEDVARGVAATEDEAKAAVAAWCDSPAAALESIRLSIRAESVSMGELAMLQGMVEFIDPDDDELLQWAGVPEYPAGDLPAPGEAFAQGPVPKGIVVASCWLDDDASTFAMLLLRPEKPGKFYAVVEVKGDAITYIAAYPNIIPAAGAYQELTGLDPAADWAVNEQR